MFRLCLSGKLDTLNGKNLILYPYLFLSFIKHELQSIEKLGHLPSILLRHENITDVKPAVPVAVIGKPVLSETGLEYFVPVFERENSFLSFVIESPVFGFGFNWSVLD